jgi:hypothetical protein
LTKNYKNILVAGSISKIFPAELRVPATSSPDRQRKVFEEHYSEMNKRCLK